MLLRRFYDAQLAQASYLLGCTASGEALVIDPNRDVAPYLQVAAEEGLRITQVTETHIHADFVSGSRELRAKTGAVPLLSGEGGDDWRYRYAAADGATILRDGDVINVGNIRVEVQHTPGHTPEHLAFLVTDTAAATRPMGVFTGDFVFVGDVGRPDLLERAAKVAGTMEAGARDLFRSLQRFKTLPDYLQIWPAHGAGSACGKALGAVPSSTIGYERLANWAFAIEDEATFVSAVLAGQPDPPRYFAHMKAVNRDGPAVIHLFPKPAHLAHDEVRRRVADGAQLVDTRPAAAFADGHLKGALNIPWNRSFPTWAGWLLRYDRPIVVVGDHSVVEGPADVVRSLALIGFDEVAGYLPFIELPADVELGTLPSISVAAAAGRLRNGEVSILDVRSRSEWEGAHIPGAANIPLGYLEELFDGVPSDRPVVLQCQTGGRSAIAASLLQSRGVGEVFNLTGGIVAWREAGNPIEAGQAAPLGST